MKRTLKTIGMVVAICLALIGCRKPTTKPQNPANKPEVDTVAQNLLYTNQVLVEQTNRDLSLWIKYSQTPFVQHEYGFWYRWLQRTDADLLQEEQSVVVHYQVWLLDSTQCADIKREVKVGRKEVPPAIDYSLSMMRTGEAVEIIAPWYSAYGQKGEDLVPPYTNVRFRVEIEE